MVCQLGRDTYLKEKVHVHMFVWAYTEGQTRTKKETGQPHQMQMFRNSTRCKQGEECQVGMHRSRNYRDNLNLLPCGSRFTHTASQPGIPAIPHTDLVNISLFCFQIISRKPSLISISFSSQLSQISLLWVLPNKANQDVDKERLYSEGRLAVGNVPNSEI